MFERFTDRARRVVMLAQEEARDLKHNYIGTEHLLLGLLREEEGLGGKALMSVGLDLDSVRSEVQRRVGKGPEEPHGHIPFTPRAKKVLELSLRQSLSMAHNYIGTEHILLGLLQEGEGVAAQVLMAKVEHGLTGVHQAVNNAMQEAGVGSASGIEMGKEPGTVRRWGRLGVHLPSTSMRAELRSDDEVVKRLEAIEARLSAIERLLREQRGSEETG